MMGGGAMIIMNGGGPAGPANVALELAAHAMSSPTSRSAARCNNTDGAFSMPATGIIRDDWGPSQPGRPAAASTSG